MVPLFHVNAWGLPYIAPMIGLNLVMPGVRLDGPNLFELMDSEAGVLVGRGAHGVERDSSRRSTSSGRKPAALRGDHHRRFGGARAR